MIRVPLAAVLPGPAVALLAQVGEAVPDDWLVGAGILTPLLLILARVLTVEGPMVGTARADRRARREAEAQANTWERRTNRWYLRAQRLVDDEDHWHDRAQGRNQWGDREPLGTNDQDSP